MQKGSEADVICYAVRVARTPIAAIQRAASWRFSLLNSFLIRMRHETALPLRLTRWPLLCVAMKALPTIRGYNRPIHLTTVLAGGLEWLRVITRCLLAGTKGHVLPVVELASHHSGGSE